MFGLSKKAYLLMAQVDRPYAFLCHDPKELGLPNGSVLSMLQHGPATSHAEATLPYLWQGTQSASSNTGIAAAGKPVGSVSRTLLRRTGAMILQDGPRAHEKHTHLLMKENAEWCLLAFPEDGSGILAGAPDPNGLRPILPIALAVAPRPVSRTSTARRIWERQLSQDAAAWVAALPRLPAHHDCRHGPLDEGRTQGFVPAWSWFRVRQDWEDDLLDAFTKALHYGLETLHRPLCAEHQLALLGRRIHRDGSIGKVSLQLLDEARDRNLPLPDDLHRAAIARLDDPECPVKPIRQAEVLMYRGIKDRSGSPARVLCALRSGWSEHISGHEAMLLLGLFGRLIDLSVPWKETGLFDYSKFVAISSGS